MWRCPLKVFGPQADAVFPNGNILVLRVFFGRRGFKQIISERGDSLGPQKSFEAKGWLPLMNHYIGRPPGLMFTCSSSSQGRGIKISVLLRSNVFLSVKVQRIVFPKQYEGKGENEKTSQVFLYLREGKGENEKTNQVHAVDFVRKTMELTYLPI